MSGVQHSVTLNTDLCKGCTHCIKRCPTEAIRVRNGKAVIKNERTSFRNAVAHPIGIKFRGFFCAAAAEDLNTVAAFQGIFGAVPEGYRRHPETEYPVSCPGEEAPVPPVRSPAAIARFRNTGLMPAEPR